MTPDPVLVPFAPALDRLVVLLFSQANAAAADVIRAEAKALGFPEGIAYDLERRAWLVPPASEP